MRTKFKVSILSMLAIVFTFAFVLVGCGDSKTSGETISLTEAKTLIVSALATDDNPDNRSIFAKFGKTQVEGSGIASNYNTSETLSTATLQGQFEYSNNICTKLIFDLYSTQVEGYIDSQIYSPNGEIVFYQNESDVLETDKGVGVDTISNNSDIGKIISGAFGVNLTVIGSLFTDDNFSKFYKENTIKTTTDAGYELAFQLNLKETARFSYVGYENFEDFWDRFYTSTISPAPQEIKDLIIPKLTLMFDFNNQITGLKIILTDLTLDPETNSYLPMTASLTISKYTGEITEPQWVTDYLAEQAQTQE